MSNEFKETEINGNKIKTFLFKGREVFDLWKTFITIYHADNEREVYKNYLEADKDMVFTFKLLSETTYNENVITPATFDNLFSDPQEVQQIIDFVIKVNFLYKLQQKKSTGNQQENLKKA